MLVNPSILEAEVGEAACVQHQLGLHNKTPISISASSVKESILGVGSSYLIHASHICCLVESNDLQGTAVTAEEPGANGLV